MTTHLFRDRRDAGRFLAGLLRHHKGDPDVVVLGLPRGGVPVAYEVALALGAPLDAYVVRKLGLPERSEVAMGALASGGVVVLDEDVVRGFDVTAEQLQQVAEQESRELLRREQAYRQGRPALDVTGKVVILVDDGLATGSSMRAAIQGLRALHPASIVVAVPAAPASTCRELDSEVDEVVCATSPSPFLAVGRSYWDFSETTDEEVRELLDEAGPRPGAGPRERSEAAVVGDAALPTERGIPSTDVLLDLVGDAQLVLLGEASHGTAEFYEARAEMTRRLVEERGFCAVAAEADWPDAYRLNRWVRGRSDDADAEEALRGFQRFPQWMWRNTAVLDFAGWLRDRNDRLPAGPAQAGFYGLDLYSLHQSAREVVAYLEGVDPDAAARARERYSCFDHHDRSQDGQAYGMAVAFGAGEGCEREAVEQLVELQRRSLRHAADDGWLAEDERFAAEVNARVVRDAESYYRSMVSGRVNTWNLRDTHMVETLELLVQHLGRQRGEPARVVVWAHNSHLGDARVTEMGMRGELNVGQLVRERHPLASRSLGFTTHAGTVTAADDWGGPAQRKRVRESLSGSVEELFHQVGREQFMVWPQGRGAVHDLLSSARLERAIGVIYRPETERQSHYFRARVADQFDAVVHLDETRALEPLERTAGWERGEAPETYPFAV
jgi:erythromycin esterase-like protein/predicted phosphoribosyltransferase